MNDPIQPVNVAESNARFDRENHDLTRIRYGFRPDMLIRRGKLTDRKIAQYEKRGYYSADFRQARKELWQRKAKHRRSGNFEVLDDGRMIYNPF